MEQLAEISADVSPESNSERLTRIINQLMQRAETLIESIDEPTITAAPLNQRSSALNAVRATLDLLFKVQQQMMSQSANDDVTGQVIRIEYQYPDGTIHSTPPWAGKNARQPEAVSGRSLWETFWENADGEDAAH